MMWGIVLGFFVLAKVGQGACPDGFELVRDGECRGSVTNMSLTLDKAIGTAIAKCNEIRAQPIIIHNDEQQSYWTDRAPRNVIIVGDPIMLLGLVCNTTSTKFMWADGSPIDYKPKTYDAVLDGSCAKENSLYITSNGIWNLWTGGNPFIVDVSCTKQVDFPIDDSCNFFDDDSDDGVCYQVGATAETWQDAQMTCKKLGANLASIHNLQENSFLRRLAVSKGDVNGVLLGATISGKESNFGWIDGTEWDYDNFAPGFPRPGFGDCIVMDTSTSAGKWKNIDYTEAYPIACIREKKTPVQTACSTETWKEGAIITSPGFPYNASEPCDYYLMVDDGKRVEVEIILLEANSCCDNFILYDGYVGGVVLANLTGAISNATYTTTSSHKMLVSWQPNGRVNVMGLAMTFRGV